MIITSVHAENFQSYKLIKIDDLPEQGIVHISGDADSGKNDVIDALSFVLFGRTFATPQKDATQLIYPEAKKLSVIITFKQQNTLYRLTRSIMASDDTHARLVNETTNEVLANSSSATKQQLSELLSCDYASFANALYLSPDVFSTAHANSQNVKELLGIGQYEQMQQEFKVAAQEGDKTLALIRPQYEAIHKEIARLSMDDTWMPDLVDARETLDAKQVIQKRSIAGLKREANQYPENKSNYDIAASRYNLSKLLSDIMLAIAIGLVIAWGVFEFLPTEARALMYPDTPALFPIHQSWMMTWAIPAAIFLIVLFFVMLLVTWNVEDKSLRPLLNKTHTFTANLKAGYHEATENVYDLLPRKVSTLVGASSHDATTLKLSNADKLFDKIGKHKASSKDAFEAAHQIHLTLQKKSRDMEHYQERVNAEIDAEAKRTELAAGVRQRLTSHDKKIRQYAHEIRVKNTAITLLKASAEDITQDFNQTTAKRSAKLLPQFTQQQYSELRINDEMKADIFSNSAQDFIDYDKLPIAARQQTILGLRLALAEQSLASLQDSNEDEEHNDGQKIDNESENTEKHFIIIPEPFSRFSRDQILETRQLLVSASDMIRQVWLITQERPLQTEGTNTLSIQCKTGQDELVVAGQTDQDESAVADKNE